MSDLTIEDYEEVLASHRRLVRELDVLLNGEEGAAKQASLCDIVGQVKREVQTRGHALLSHPWPQLTMVDKLAAKIDVSITGKVPPAEMLSLILNNLHNTKAIINDFNNLANLEGQYLKTMGELVDETVDLLSGLQLVQVDITPK